MSGECDDCGNHAIECCCGQRGLETGFTECEIMQPDADGWSEWIHPIPGYKVQCCDCGLVHEMEVAIGETVTEGGARNDGETADRVVLFRMRRA